MLNVKTIYRTIAGAGLVIIPAWPSALAADDQFTSALGEKASALFGMWIGEKAVGEVSWFTIILCVVILGLVVALERLLRWLIWKRAGAVLNAGGVLSLFGHFIQALSRPFSVAFFTAGIYIALMPLFGHFILPDGTNPFQSACGTAVHLIIFIVVIWLLVRLVDLLDIQIKQWAEKTPGTIDDLLVPLVGKSLRVVIIILGGILFFQNMTGIKIGPLLASLGIGGIAVALAAKDSLANFFGTLTIIFDKPFQTGDRILIDGNDGVVESVGFRSTKIRTLAGHLLTVPNEKVTNTFIENIGRRPNIRWLTNIGITYGTPPDKVRQAVAVIKAILKNHEGMREDFPPRVYFNNFNDWSLNIMVVAWYHPPDYWAYQEWVQKTCLEIMRRFAEAGIDFAFPSRTIYLAGEDGRPAIIKPPSDKA